MDCKVTAKITQLNTLMMVPLKTGKVEHLQYVPGFRVQCGLKRGVFGQVNTIEVDAAALWSIT